MRRYLLRVGLTCEGDEPVVVAHRLTAYKLWQSFSSEQSLHLLHRTPALPSGLKRKGWRRASFCSPTGLLPLEMWSQGPPGESEHSGSAGAETSARTALPGPAAQLHAAEEERQSLSEKVPTIKSDQRNLKAQRHF